MTVLLRAFVFSCVVASCLVSTIREAAAQLECFGGETTNTRRYFLIDTTAGTCTNSTSNPAPPTDGLRLQLNSNPGNLFVPGQTFDGGIQQATIGLTTLSNYTGSLTGGNRFINDTVPSSGTTSTLVMNFVILGVPHSVTINDITKTDGVDSVTYGTVIISGGAFDAPAATGATAQQTQRTISNFMSRRADQITVNDPDLAERLKRGSNTDAGSNGNAVNFTANGTGSNNQASLSTSLRQVAQAAKTNKDKRAAELGGMMGLGSQPLSGTSVSNGFDVWVEGKWVKIDGDTAESNLGLLYVGADYRLNSSLLIGVLGQFDWSDEEDDVNGSDIDGRGWMAGPYVVGRLHNNLIFDGRAAWGRSNNDVSPDRTYTDSFETKRWLLKGQLTGDFDQGAWHFAPHVGIIYFEEDQEGYTDSNGNAIGSQTVSLGRVTFGPKVSTSFQAGGGMVVSPHLGIKGIWDFDKAEVVDVATGIAAGSNDLRARVESGLTIQMPGGLLLSGEGFYDGIGADDFDAYGGSAKFTVPLN